VKSLAVDRVALITGAAGGIGSAIADYLERAGAICVRADISEADGVTCKFDVTKKSEWLTAVDAVAQQYGRIDILINSAGVTGHNMPSWDVTEQEWDRVIAVNLSGTFYGCQTVLPHMIAQKYGRVVNLSSIAGKEGNPGAAAYAASKAGVIGLTKAIAKEVCTNGVLINCVTPAAIDTPILKDLTEDFRRYVVSLIPMRRIGRPEEVAALVAWLASEECSFSTGAVFDISGGRATY
jgi:2-dehydro-3-deoxy-L-rhamnonate dehydrogenase (NAD+)